MSGGVSIPRIVIAGTGSGSGKTSAAVGIIGALKKRGLSVAAFKVGPDYLDPTYLSRASGRQAHNLDGWMMSETAALSTFATGSEGADIAVIEGVMGLFDGAGPQSEDGSTAQMAKWLKAPVILMVNASGMARTICAIAQGFTSYDPGLRIAAIICNRTGGERHLEYLKETAPCVPIAGGFPKSDNLAFPERHLGLRTASRNAVPDEIMEGWGALAEKSLDLDMIFEIARSAPQLNIEPVGQVNTGSHIRPRIGVAFDDAFHFYYEYNLSLLKSYGAELVRFSPVNDAKLPEVDGLYIGGGYPEVYAEKLSSNKTMLESVRQLSADGAPVYAECGGLMYLSDSIVTTDNKKYTMAGVIPGVCTMSDKLKALGYVEAITVCETILGPPGLSFRGHQFRYSDIETDTVELSYRVTKRRDGTSFDEGFRIGNTVGSYIHAHWAQCPSIAENLVKSCAKFSQTRQATR